jgi:hypothetical protein
MYVVNCTSTLYNTYLTLCITYITTILASLIGFLTHILIVTFKLSISWLTLNMYLMCEVVACRFQIL